MEIAVTADGERRQDVRACYCPVPAWCERVTLEVSIYSHGLSWRPRVSQGREQGPKVRCTVCGKEVQSKEGVFMKVDSVGRHLIVYAKKQESRKEITMKLPEL